MLPICYSLDSGTRTITVARCQRKDINVEDVVNGDTGKGILSAKHHLVNGVQVPLKSLERRQWRKGIRPLLNLQGEEKGAINQ